MKKTFIIDTNVILQSPTSLFVFGKNLVVIPSVVIEELDRFKKENSELGANARKSARILDDLREQGDLTKGVLLENGGTLKIEMNHTDVDMSHLWREKTNDNRILQVCKGLSDLGHNVYLITRDVFIRIKANSIGINAQDFFNEQAPVYEEQYKGYIEVYTTNEKIDEFYTAKSINIEDICRYDEQNKKQDITCLENNQFLVIHSLTTSAQNALGKFDGEKIIPLQYNNEHPYGVTPKNALQRFMQEALMIDADKIPLVIIKGPAGTAKTFYSMAVGLHKVLIEREKKYRKILICRPNIKMDEDIGFLPGTEEEKIAPFMRPIVDNLEILVDNNENERYKDELELKDKIVELFSREIINTEAIAYIRGRSIVKQWVLIDEAQNLTPKQVKGIITRAGKGTKIILVGDPEQIDHPFLDSRTNGLCYAADRMKGSTLCMQISLSDKDCERSPLAHEGSKKM